MGISANAHSFNYFVAVYKEAIHSKIVSYLPSFENESFTKVVREYIDRMGQYRRPGLVLLSGRLFGVDEKELLLPAAAQQASEDWILMQDDAFDGSEYRRGKPAAHRLYGWPNAINASDVGHMAMWRILKDYSLQVGPKKGNRMFEKFYDMLSYTAEGQYIENNFIHFTKSLKNASEVLYFRIADSKTCYYTVYGPMQIGAIAADQHDSVLNALKEIGQSVGIAFQIVDDILDMSSDESKFGKKNFGDLYEGKLTLMMLNSYKCATPLEKEKIDKIYSKERQSKTPDEIDFLKEMIEKYKGLEYARRTAQAYGERAKVLLNEHMHLIPQNEFTPIIMSAIEELYVRKK
jgi:geranylgeranyl pyrophosphate synthase